MQGSADECLQIFPGKTFIGKFFRGQGKYKFKVNIKCNLKSRVRGYSVLVYLGIGSKFGNYYHRNKYWVQHNSCILKQASG